MKITYFNIYLAIIFLFLTSSCGAPTNKEKYNIKVGEELRLYGITHAGGCYKLCNKSDLKHLKYIGQETVIPYSEAAGSATTVAEKFKSISSGTDTVILAIIWPCRDCGHYYDQKYERYQINIK